MARALFVDGYGSDRLSTGCPGLAGTFCSGKCGRLTVDPTDEKRLMPGPASPYYYNQYLYL
jgi:hypothetical protein